MNARGGELREIMRQQNIVLNSLKLPKIPEDFIALGHTEGVVEVKGSAKVQGPKERKIVDNIYNDETGGFLVKE
eukprot:12880551-Prorocentrum_lima.AAC.1